jgi:CRP-like cAMP-binding protein
MRGSRLPAATMSQAVSPSRPHNLLLGSLPRADFARLSPVLEPVYLALGQHLHQPGSTQDHFYFPGTSIVSLIGVLRNGDATELSLVGCEGGVGVGLILGGETTLTRATVQSAGTALRWKAASLKRELKRCGVVQRMLLRYVQAIWTQTAQSALCNRHHTLQQQLCKLLLLSLDRVDDNVLRMTQQLIADMIGVRREGVAIAAKKLEILGWISYSRGVIVVLNRAALEANACECYQTVNWEYRRLLGWPKAHRKPRSAALSPSWPGL